MIGYRTQSAGRAKRNEGFTLMELIISITILVLILLPLMSNFYNSMRMNKKAEDIQIQSNLASSIMEGLKNYDMEDTIKQFAGEVTDFDIITDVSAENVMNLNYDEASGQYSEVDILPEGYHILMGQATNYFAIYGIKDGSSAYDALIQMKSSGYRTGSILNNYPMPDPINLDSIANAQLFSGGEGAGSALDNEALSTFQTWGEDYAKRVLYVKSSRYLSETTARQEWLIQRENAEMRGEPIPPEPTITPFDPNDAIYDDYCDESILRSRITKSMKITVNQDSQITVAYSINYSINWPSGSEIDNLLEYPISVKTYKSIDELTNVFLFYEPSIFKDTIRNHPDIIELENQTSSKPINFYLARQGTSAVLPHVTLTISEGVSVFTNLDSMYVNGLAPEDLTNDIVKSEQRDRIYEVEVKIYKYVASDDPADKFKKELYTLRSTRED